MNGYQQGFLIATGCKTGERYSVRNIDRWYCDAVAELFGTKVYPQLCHGKTQWVVKSSRVSAPILDEIMDWPGFLRAWIEIKGTIDIRKVNGSFSPRLRIYGSEEILLTIMNHIPAKPKKIQYIQNTLKGVYIVETHVIYFQSFSEIYAILKYINGHPRNQRIWYGWNKKLDLE